MSQLDLVTVGEAFEDLIFVNLPHLPAPGEEVKTSEFVQTVGGGALITIVAATRLGLRCGIVSGLSDAAEKLLRRERVWVRNLREASEPPAISAALSIRGNRSFVTFNGVNDRLEPRLFDAMADVSARHVHLAFFPRECRKWETVLHDLRRRGVSTSWDFGWNQELLADRRFPFLMTSVDYLFVNEQEALLYARRRTLEDAVQFWQTHPHHVVIKMGQRGSHLIAGRRHLKAAPRRVRAVDSTGAGDAFDGGFLTGLLTGQPLAACLRLGNLVGALSTRAAGGIDGLPTRDEAGVAG